MPQAPATKAQIDRIMALLNSIRETYDDEHLSQFYSGATQRAELERISQEDASYRILRLEEILDDGC